MIAVRRRRRNPDNLDRPVVQAKCAQADLALAAGHQTVMQQRRLDLITASLKIAKDQPQRDPLEMLIPRPTDPVFDAVQIRLGPELRAPIGWSKLGFRDWAV